MTTSQPARNRCRWTLDFTSKSSSSSLASPPGFTCSWSASQLQNEAARSSDQGNLRAKRSWDLALGPIKQVPMNLFIMYMSGNTISIFPIMMVLMMTWRPFKTLFSVNATFKTLDVATNSDTNEAESSSNSSSNVGQKCVFVLGNIVNIALAMYKCHSMGLLPTHASDWLAFAHPVTRAEFAYIA